MSLQPVSVSTDYTTIVNGPTRESLFDSLRLALLRVRFEFTSKQSEGRVAVSGVVTLIEKLGNNGHAWNVTLRVENARLNGDPTHITDSRLFLYYRDHNRTGQITRTRPF